MTKNILLAIALIFSLSIANGENPNQIRAINNYVSFLNESIHGLLIAHRLFENYNQTVNRYVDLPEYQLNNYSNADLPDNIFIDPEHWFYDRSPYEWHEIAMRESKYLGSDASTINAHISKIKNILSEVNKKRIGIDQLLLTKDFSRMENLKFIYNELESVVTLYDKFYDTYRTAEQELRVNHGAQGISEDQAFVTFQKAFLRTYTKVKEQLHIIRKEGEISEAALSNIKKALLNVERIISEEGQNQSQKRILTNMSRLVRTMGDFLSKKEIPKEYKLHGRHYYYYNIALLNRTNRYGNGFVQEYNILCQAFGQKTTTEIPQVFKVLYPEKLPKEDLAALDARKLIIRLDKVSKTKLPRPEEIENRNIIVHRERIVIDSSSFDLELYDHLIKDGDRVSININGVWKFRNISLEKTPQIITINIVPGQKNFILIHADNTGYRPPNTVAIAYMNKGERKEINLESDLENSQVVEILYEEGN